MRWTHWQQYLTDSGQSLEYCQNTSRPYVVHRSTPTGDSMMWRAHTSRDELIEALRWEALDILIIDRTMRGDVEYALSTGNVRYMQYCLGERRTPGRTESARQGKARRAHHERQAEESITRLRPHDLITAARIQKEMWHTEVQDGYRRRYEERRAELSAAALRSAIAGAQPSEAVAKRTRL